MKLSYKLTNRPVITTSQLVSSTLQEAMFYMYKEHDVVSYELEVRNPYLDLSSKIYSTENLKNVFKVKTNTTDIMITDVSVNSVPYYYELKATNNSYITLNELLLNTELEAVEYNGKLYTNTFVTNYEVKDGIFISSVATINSSDYSIKYYNNDILVSVPKKRDDILFAKTSHDNCMTPQTVNDNSIIFPSFYLKTRSNIYQFIEGDIITLNKKELTRVEGNVVKLKDKALHVKTLGTLSEKTNTLFLPDSYISSKDLIVEYSAKRSSHIFEVEDTLFLKLLNNNLIKTTEAECDVVITKKIDTSKLYLRSNDFLDTYLSTFRAKEYAFLHNQTLTESKKKMLTRYLQMPSYVNPSDSYYIKIDSKEIRQRKSVDVSRIGLKSKEDIEDFLEDDYLLPEITVLNSENDKAEIKSIEQQYYIGV